MKTLAFLGKVALVYADLVFVPLRIVTHEVRSMLGVVRDYDPFSWEDDYEAGLCAECPNRRAK